MAGAKVRLVVRWPLGGSALERYVGLSIAGHLLLVATLVGLSSIRPRTVSLDDVMFVELSAMPAGPRATVQAPPAQQDPTPPEPVPEVRQPPPEPEPEPVKLPEKPVEKKKPPKKIEEPQPRPRETAPARPAPAQTPPPTPATGTGPANGASAGSGVTALDFGGGSELAWYGDSVKAALYGQWTKPILEGLREPLEVRVTFEIQTDGSVRNVRIDTSSGVASLDRSVLRAVADATPLPPLPRVWHEPALPAAFLFRLNPE